KSSNKKKKKNKIQLHEFKTTNGLTVLVGKNNKQNDYLTSKKAQNNHLWFHTKDIPGSHVVITHAAHEIEDEDILEAAMIAAFHSKAGNSESVPVDTPILNKSIKYQGQNPVLSRIQTRKQFFSPPLKKKVN